MTAQNILSVQLEHQRQRIPMEVQYGDNTLEVCGLVPGTTYMFIAVPGVLGDKTPMTLHLTDLGLEAMAKELSRPDRPQQRVFVAAEACVTLSLSVDDSAQSGSMPIYLSASCVDCAEAAAFRDEFFKQMGDGLGMANLSVTGGVTPASMVSTFTGGDCFQLSNVTAQGPAQSRGIFSNGATNIGINTGIVLCTGDVSSLRGPNVAGNTSGNTMGFNVNSPDDPDLATLTDGNQFDVIKLEFDFTPTAESVSFEYVFGSEEYCEYANSQFNDVFGFFISGPGINGSQNIALLPVSGNPPVAINNVNHLSNTAYYVNNNTFAPCQSVGACCAQECALDGWTTVLTTTISNLIPCETYRIKLAIADIFDGAYFSAVFLKANSFNAGGAVNASPAYPAGFQDAIEGCSGTSIRFVRAGNDTSEPLVVNFTIGGTATPGVDYEVLPNTITIPAGATFLDLPVNTFIDNIVEGQETIAIKLENLCSCNTVDFTLYIQDKAPLEVELQDIDLCGVPNATLSPNIISPGQSPLTYFWSSGQSSQSITAHVPGPTVYTVTVTDACGDTATAAATVTLEPAPTATINNAGMLCVGENPSVGLSITFTGFSPWILEINHNGNTQTEIFTSSPGAYTVTEVGTYSLVSIVSESGCTGTVTGTVTVHEGAVSLSVNATDPTCSGADNGHAQAFASGGDGPFTYAWNNGSSEAIQTGLAPGIYTVTVTNGQGCTAEETIELTEPSLLSNSIVTDASDSSSTDGSILLVPSGGTEPYEAMWSNGGTGLLQDGLPPGAYFATVTDANGCTATTPVILVGVTSTTAEPHAATNWQVLPNPASDAAEVVLGAPAPAALPVRLWAADGRLVWQGILPAGAQRLALPVSGLPSGMYLVEVAGSARRLEKR